MLRFPVSPRWLLALTVWTASCSATANGGGPAPFMMKTVVAGRLLEGQPLTWTDAEMVLLGRDGALYEFDPRQAEQSEKIGGRYQAFSMAEMKARLRQEFDSTYEVAATQHFVVVHPRGRWQAWADRMETLYRSFVRYMSVRGFRPRTPPAPMPAIVFRNQSDYYRHAAESGTRLGPGSLGHYSPRSNRMYLFDATAATGDADQIANFETIVHEATHQTAYNVGVHQRFTEQPRWLVEGLAMMFEARGVYANSATSARDARINRGRLSDYRWLRDHRAEDWILRLVASDDRFRTNPSAAYAESWALHFYLCESRPQQYAAYLGRVAQRPSFRDYPPPARAADFVAAFGDDLATFTAQLDRFVDALP